MAKKSILKRVWSMPIAVKMLAFMIIYFIGSTIYGIYDTYAVKHLYDRTIFYHIFEGGLMPLFKIFAFLFLLYQISLRQKKTRPFLAWATMGIFIFVCVVIVGLTVGSSLHRLEIKSGYGAAFFVFLMLYILCTSLLLFFSKGACSWFNRTSKEEVVTESHSDKKPV